jgi:hypothetical protein
VAFLKYAENEYSAKHQHVPVNKLECLPRSKLIPSATASASFQSSFDPYHLSRDDEEYVIPNNTADTTPGQSDHIARILTATKLYLTLPSEPQMNWVQINLNLNDFHSDPMGIGRTLWIRDIPDWWPQQEETNSKYANLSNLPPDIISIIPHVVGVEASFSLGLHVISWRQSKTIRKTLHEKVIVRQVARANNGILARTDPE